MTIHIKKNKTNKTTKKNIKTTKKNKTNETIKINPQVLMAQRAFSHRAGTTNKYNKGNLVDLQKEITIKFLYILNTVKLYHWKTNSYAVHKATDELYSKLNENFDKFVEILLGKLGNRIHLEKYHSLELTDLNTVEDIKNKVMQFKSYLVNLDDNKSMNEMRNTDLYNVRDEILGDLNQFLYLLSFK